MSRKIGKTIGICFLAILVAFAGIAGVKASVLAKAEKKEQVPQGVFVNGEDFSGMSFDELEEQLKAIEMKLKEGKIVLSIEGNDVETSMEKLGIEIDTKKTENKIKSIGRKGNIVVRYKELKDAKEQGVALGVGMTWEEPEAALVLSKLCKKYEEPAVNYGLKHENGTFTVTEGKAGYEVNKATAREQILDQLGGSWNGSKVTIKLSLETATPKGSAEELAKVKDLLGEASTSYATSSADRAKNVERGAGLVNGTVLYPGEQASFYELVAPIDIANGYFMAASYASGQVVESPGGGICQVSTTLYGALMQAELAINERSCHSMIVNYVEPSMDAAIAGTYKDLKFTNNTENPVFIEGITAGRKLTFRIYGVESRPANRRVEYESVILEETEPEVVLVPNWEAGAGVLSTIESPHKGYKAKTVKRVYVDNELVEEKDYNSSKYKMTPKKVSVGMVTDNPEYAAALSAAVSVHDLESVNALIATYGVAQNPVPATPNDGTTPVTDGTQSADGAAQPTDGAAQPVDGAEPEPEA